MLLAFGSGVYVDGYGWVSGRVVSHCLMVVGAEHEAELYDAQWEAFTDCLTGNS